MRLAHPRIDLPGGDRAAVEKFTAGREVIHREALGRVTSVTVLGVLTPAERAELAAENLEVGAVSLQQLIVRLTARATGDPTHAVSEVP